MLLAVSKDMGWLVRSGRLSAVIKMSSWAMVVAMTNFVHGILVNLAVISEDLAQYAFMSKLGRRVDTCIKEKLFDGGRGAATHCRRLAKDAFGNFQSWVGERVIVESNFVGTASTGRVETDGVDAAVIVAVKHVGDALVIGNVLGDKEWVIIDGFNNREGHTRVRLG
jgi:hypothetical protein